MFEIEENILPLEGTTPAEEDIEIPEEELETEEEGTTPAEEEGTAEEKEVEEDNFSLPIRFNHENFDLSREEAITLSQKGKFFEAHESNIDKLEFIAERIGTTPESILNGLLETVDKSDLETCIEEAGGDTFKGQSLFNERKSASRRALDEKKAQRLNDNNLKEFTEKKLADEFLKYKEELGYKTVDDIPQEVINLSLKENISLFDAQLRYNFSEGKKKEKQINKQKENAERGMNSLGKNTEPDDFSKFAQMLLDA